MKNPGRLNEIDSSRAKQRRDRMTAQHLFEIIQIRTLRTGPTIHYIFIIGSRFNEKRNCAYISFQTVIENEIKLMKPVVCGREYGIEIISMRSK